MKKSDSCLVAVVDDDSDVRTALQRLLWSAGFDAETFPSGEAFLRFAESRVPDCVVLDLHMPGLSGAEVQERLAAEHAGVPVVLITAHAPSLLRPDAPQSCLRKPIDQNALLSAIQSAIGGRQPRGLH